MCELKGKRRTNIEVNASENTNQTNTEKQNHQTRCANFGLIKDTIIFHCKYVIPNSSGQRQSH